MLLPILKIWCGSYAIPVMDMVLHRIKEAMINSPSEAVSKQSIPSSSTSILIMIMIMNK